MGLSEVLAQGRSIDTERTAHFHKFEDGNEYNSGGNFYVNLESNVAAKMSLTKTMDEFAQNGQESESYCATDSLQNEALEDLVSKLLQEDSAISDCDSWNSGSGSQKSEDFLPRNCNGTYPLGGNGWTGLGARLPTPSMDIQREPVALMPKNYELLTVDLGQSPPPLGTVGPPTLLTLAALRASMDRDAYPAVSPDFVYPPRRDNSIDSGYTQSPGQSDSIVYGQGLPDDQQMMNFIKQFNAEPVAFSLAHHLAIDDLTTNRDVAAYNVVRGQTAPAVRSMKLGGARAESWAACGVTPDDHSQPHVQAAAIPQDFIAFPKNLSANQMSNISQQPTSTDYPLCLNNNSESRSKLSPMAMLDTAVPVAMPPAFNPLVPPPQNGRFGLPRYTGLRTSGVEFGLTAEPPTVSPKALLHHRLEQCREQFRLLVSECKKWESDLVAELGKPILFHNSLAVPRVPLDRASHVDHLIADQYREHSRVLTLICIMEQLNGEPMDRGINSVVYKWSLAFREVHECRKEEILNIDNHYDNDQEDVVALAHSIHALGRICRSVRTVLWSALQITKARDSSAVLA